MKYNLVLDNNIWLNFIEKVEFDLLERLLEEVKNNRLNIILPDFIHVEFDKKKDQVISRTLKDKKDISKQDLYSIVQTILNIFKLSTKLKTEEIGINDWIKSEEAPNHNANNYEDTVILNTLLTLKRGTVLYLVSNDSDYRISKNNYSIHPDIKKRFKEKGIDVHFSTNISKTFFDLGFPSINNLDELNTNELYNWKAFRLKVKEENIFTQLKEAIKYYYRELDFIPLSYLPNIYPLKSNNNSQTYLKGTTLILDNKKLFDFFKDALIEYKNKDVIVNESYFTSKQEISEFKKILKKLNNNLIYSISYKRRDISICIKEEKKIELCDCMDCTLHRYAIKDLTIKLQDDNLKNTPKNILEKAFYYYKIKDYSKALELTNKILSTYNKDEFSIIYNIAQENKIILQKMWFNDDEEFEIERKKIKLKNENETLKQGISSITGYLKYSKFFDYKFYSLNEDLEKVKKRYDNHNGLGSSNFYGIDLKNIIRWAEVINVITSNGLFFDFYSNINTFALTTFKLNLISTKDRVIRSNINIYILKTTLQYIKIEDYKKVFNEFAIHELNLNKTQTQEIYIYFESILNNSSQIKQLSKEHPYHKHYINQIKKIAFLIGYINFSKPKTNNLISKLFRIYPENEREEKKVLFDSLINNRIKSINRKNALSYIDLCYKNEIDYSFNINNIFRLVEYFKTIYLSQSQLEILFIEDIQDKTGYYRSYVLYKLYNLNNKTIKNKVLGIVYSTLNNELTFDYKLFSLFVRQNIISNSEEYYNIFQKITINDYKLNKNLNYPNKTDKEIKNLRSLNEFINYAYECYDDTEKHLKIFSGRSNYYDFLISPNNVNFHEFDIHWFYIAYSKSYFAIKEIMIRNKKVMSLITNKVLKSKNDKYYKTYIDLMAHIHEN